MKKFIIGLVAFFIGIITLNIPMIAVAAPSAHSQTTHQTNTAILKKCGAEANDPEGGGIMCLLKEGLNIMTYIVGALGFAAIVWCGILYLTAGDNEEQVKKAKRRIFEIVVGVALFILANAIVQWLTGDTPDTSVLPTIYAFLG
ncbi:hypothetical protein IJS18_00810 [Candidatus Saccharibacteria bacterium]|nr:hypothetical protein [Candidatus Saccharibacteria bacterium]